MGQPSWESLIAKMGAAKNCHQRQTLIKSLMSDDPSSPSPRCGTRCLLAGCRLLPCSALIMITVPHQDSSQAHKFLSFAGTLLTLPHYCSWLRKPSIYHLTGKNIQISSDGFLIGALCHDNNLFLILLTFEIILTFPPVAAGC